MGLEHDKDREERFARTLMNAYAAAIAELDYLPLEDRSSERFLGIVERLLLHPLRREQGMPWLLYDEEPLLEHFQDRLVKRVREAQKILKERQ